MLPEPAALIGLQRNGRSLALDPRYLVRAPSPLFHPQPQTNGHLKTQNALADDSECPEMIWNNELIVLQAQEQWNGNWSILL
jgi:hypothetical protein